MPVYMWSIQYQMDKVLIERTKNTIPTEIKVQLSRSILDEIRKYIITSQKYIKDSLKEYIPNSEYE